MTTFDKQRQSKYSGLPLTISFVVVHYVIISKNSGKKKTSADNVELTKAKIIKIRKRENKKKK